jgi:excisionase family DNA binding protein
MPAHAEEHEWLTLSDASKLLGVHPATLRQWSDEGKVRIFRTPGGHRRFSRSDIERMLQVNPLRGAPLSSFVVSEVLQRTREGLPAAMQQSWATGIDDDERQRRREAGRHLIQIASQLITRDAPTPQQREAARRLGGEYGLMMARAGHNLPDAVMAFIFFRDSLLETVFSLPETTGLNRDETLAIVRRINDVLNDVLRAMMDAHAGIGGQGLGDEGTKSADAEVVKEPGA